eukprot:2882845-Pleurochrysis_carterae.AAC.4
MGLTSMRLCADAKRSCAVRMSDLRRHAKVLAESEQDVRNDEGGRSESIVAPRRLMPVQELSIKLAYLKSARSAYESKRNGAQKYVLHSEAASSSQQVTPASILVKAHCGSSTSSSA